MHMLNNGNSNKMNQMMITIVMLLIFLVMMVSVSAGTYSGGDGSSGSPYQISNIDDLQELQDTSTDWGKYFIQTADINASVTSGWDSGNGFSSIGSSATKFTGLYDGDGHKVSNLFINRPSIENMGLFGVITSDSEVKNLGVINIDVTGDQSTGGLVGWCESGTIDNCYTTGNVVGDSETGGLVGYNAGNINNSYSSVIITVGGSDDNSEVGGLVGYTSSSSEINNSYATGDVNAVDEVGGLVGDNKGTVFNCYATGNVNASKEEVGGLIGINYGSVLECYSTGAVKSNRYQVGGLIGDHSGTVEKCYAIGGVTGDDQVGGLIGQNVGMVNNSYARGSVHATSNRGGGLVGRNVDTVNKCYSNGSVTGGSQLGGLVGEVDGGSTFDSFWDTVTSGQSSSFGGTGKNTSEMQNQSTFTDAGWDFTDIWEMVSYPQLQQNAEPSPPVPELSTIILMGIGLMALIGYRGFVRKKK